MREPTCKDYPEGCWRCDDGTRPLDPGCYKGVQDDEAQEVLAAEVAEQELPEPAGYMPPRSVQQHAHAASALFAEGITDAAVRELNEGLAKVKDMFDVFDLINAAGRNATLVRNDGVAIKPVSDSFRRLDEHTYKTVVGYRCVESGQTGQCDASDLHNLAHFEAADKSTVYDVYERLAMRSKALEVLLGSYKLALTEAALSYAYADETIHAYEPEDKYGKDYHRMRWGVMMSRAYARQILDGFKIVEEALRGHCEPRIDDWLDQTIERIVRAEMMGRRYAHEDQ